MKIKTIAAILIIWNLSFLNAQACSPGNPNLVKYIRRDNNRCEGIKERTDISGSLRLVSLTTSNIKNLNDSLTLEIPRLTNNLEPEVVVRAINYRYQLDKLTLISQSNAYNFSWSTYVLKKANIPINSLRATAIIGPQSVYIPVVIGQPTNHYELVFFTNRPARFLNLEIRHNGKALSSPRFKKTRILSGCSERVKTTLLTLLTI
jgi:flagellar basal-body rod modification protein FlgD